MSHNDELVLGFQELLEGLGLHTGLYPGVLLHGLGLASEVLDALACLQHHLIAAPAQSQVQTGPCRLVAGLIGLRLHAHADAEGQRQVVSDIDGLYVLQDGEAVLHHLMDVPVHHQENVFVLFQLLYDALHGGNVVADLSVHKGCEQGPADLLHPFHGLIVIVQADESQAETGFLVDPLIAYQLRFIGEVADYHLLSRFRKESGLLLVLRKLRPHKLDAVTLPAQGGMDDGVLIVGA